MRRCERRLLKSVLDRPDSDRLGQKWLEAGLGEHASVAAFAYLVLDLLALAAPPDLVLGAIRAMEDEVEHARLCFGVARDLNRAVASPGPLSLPQDRGPRDQAVILEAAILEGCIEEVISAECARAAFERTEDAELRQVMGRISADEARHAELSWRIVTWILDQDPTLRATAQAAFAHGLRDDRSEPPADDADMPEAYGCLRQETRRQVREWTIDEIIRPRAGRLLMPDLELSPG